MLFCFFFATNSLQYLGGGD